MAEQTRRARKAGRRRREAPRPERPRVDAPPGLSAELTFPWVSGLGLGYAPVPAVPRPRHAPLDRRRRKPVAE